MTLSGPEWCSKFPTSVALEELKSPFRENCNAFIAALETAGAVVKVSATYRPPERAALMHYSCMIAYAKMDPSLVPMIPGVDIQWDWGNAPQSVQAAIEMAKGYGIVYPAALVSRHTQRLAIDMSIGFQDKLTLPHCEIDAAHPSTLYTAGATYKVIKLLSDPAHWSVDGH